MRNSKTTEALFKDASVAVQRGPAATSHRIFCRPHTPTHWSNKLYPRKGTRKFNLWYPDPYLCYSKTTRWRCCISTKRKFTPEEIEKRKANKYTLRVTPDIISYTLAFKEAFWKLGLVGCTGTAAFRKLSDDTNVVEFERIHNTAKRIRRDTQIVDASP